MSILNILGSIFEPAAKIIDELHTSQEEKAQAQIAFEQAKTQAMAMVLDFQAKMLDAQKEIIVSEAKGESAAQRNWRPHLMYLFMICIAWNVLLAPLLSLWVPNLPTIQKDALSSFPTQFWDLLMIGVGGYIGGRSVEKVVRTMGNRSLVFGKKGKAAE